MEHERKNLEPYINMAKTVCQEHGYTALPILNTDFSYNTVLQKVVGEYMININIDVRSNPESPWNRMILISIIMDDETDLDFGARCLLKDPLTLPNRVDEIEEGLVKMADAICKNS